MTNGIRTGMSMRDFVKQEGAKAEGGDILTEQGKSKSGSASLGESAKLVPEDILPDVTVTDLCVYRKDE